MAPNYPPNFDWRGSGGISVREACRRRQPMSGAEAQAMEGALAETERERDTLIRQRAADLEALNAVQALHAQAVADLRRCFLATTGYAFTEEPDNADVRGVVRNVAVLRAERDEARRQVEAMRERVRDVVSACAFNCNEESYCGTCGAILRALAVPSTNGGG